ncbi:MAG: cation:proton antiporter [Erysipelotrichaceae bacterium]|nr:cation:proton antiporter [Erysipelotrichaceae bacterium]
MDQSLLLLQVSFALIIGLMMTRVFKYLHLNLPDVTAYLIAGILIGPYFLGHLGFEGVGLLTMAEVEHLNIVSSVALGFIAFAIGNEFRLSELKSIGKKATFIGIFQALIATLLVDIVLVAVSLTTHIISIPVAITLGAIAAATAPAATLMVVRQYKAKGKITDLLLPIVAIDDAVGLIIFAVSFGIAQAIGTSHISITAIVVEPIIEIIGSLLLGTLMGVILTYLEKLFFSNKNRVALSIGFVILTITLSTRHFDIAGVNVHFSTLLVNMMMGTTLCNLCERSADIMERCDKWTTPLFALFFILSGAELEIGVFKEISMVIVGIIYIISRCIGKYYGAYFSAKVSGCDETACKYLGITLFPQAGVALGMVATAQALGGMDAVVIRNVVLFAVMIYEIFGPAMTRNALAAAGEISSKPKEKENHDRFAKA